MTIFVRMAFRNIFRHKLRSLLALLAVVMGLGSLLLIWAFTDGAHAQMTANIRSMMTGDAQIVPKELENMILSTSGVIDDAEPVRALLRRDPSVAGFTERVIGGGITFTATHSRPTRLVGVDPVQEKAIGGRPPIQFGRWLTPEDTEGVVMSATLARFLGLQIGDKVVVTVQDYYGALNGNAFRLVGAGDTGNEYMDSGNLYLLSSTLQELLSLDKRISAFVLKIAPHHAIDDAVLSLRPKVASLGLSILSWEELLPMLSQLIRYNEARNFILVLIVLAVVTLGILNTLMMSVVERTYEFGLLMAIGTKPRQVIQLVMLESFFITAFGCLLALLLGMGLTLYFADVGIDLARFSRTFFNMMIGSHVYPKIVWAHLVPSILIVFAGNLTVSLYPAWRASRLDPIEAMRQVG